MARVFISGPSDRLGQMAAQSQADSDRLGVANDLSRGFGRFIYINVVVTSSGVDRMVIELASQSNSSY